MFRRKNSRWPRVLPCDIRLPADAGLDQDAAYLRDHFGAAPGKVPADTLALYLRSQIAVAGVRGTSLAEVSLEDRDPKRAQRLVKRVVQTYLEISAEDSIQSSSAALAWLEEQSKKLEKELRDSEEELVKYKETRNLISVSMNDQSNLLREQISAYNTALTQANVKRSALAARAAALSKITTKNPDDLPASELLGDSVLQTLRADFQKARTEIGVLEANRQRLSAQGFTGRQAGRCAAQGASRWSRCRSGTRARRVERGRPAQRPRTSGPASRRRRRAANDIAEQLGLSHGTVRNYLSEAIGKLGVANRIEAYRLARQKGWL